MRIVKADLGDFPGVLSVTAKDSEGNVAALPADLIVEGSSDNPTAIELKQSTNDKFSFTLHVGGPNADGTPSQANLVINVFTADRTLIGTADETFTVTAGDAAAISVGKLDFPTLPAEPRT